MKILFASVILAFYTLQAQGQNKFATCDRAWTKIGCFKDNSRNRVLDEMLLNDRDKHSKFHEAGYRLNWHRWNESTHSLACRCAEKARQKGYTVFGLQFYGECWSGQNGELSYNREGVALDEKCVMNLNKPTECVQSSNQECVGKHWTNYVYKLTQDECKRVLDVGIILDSSGSVGIGNYNIAKNFLIYLVDKMHVANGKTHVGVIHYSSISYLDWNFESDIAKDATALKKAIQKLPYQSGWTRTDRALEMAAEMMFKPEKGDRTDVPNVLVVITDGRTSPGSKKYEDVLKPLVDNNVTMIAIGVGRSINKDELIQIANGEKDNVVQVQEFDKLVSKIHEIFKISCTSGK